MKCLVAGTCRDIERFWNNTDKCLSKIFGALEDYRCVIVESNSSDKTTQNLKEWESLDSRRTFITLGKIDELNRPKRIGISRNEYMNYFRQRGLFEEFEFLLVVDLDDVLEIENDFKSQLESCFLRNDWDAVSANCSSKYYDIWALRCTELGVNFDCIIESYKNSIIVRKPNGSFARVQNRKDYIEKYEVNIPRTRSWISCTSAFGGMTLYKTRSIKNSVYNGETTCEHIAFHKGLKMFINPAFIVGKGVVR